MKIFREIESLQEELIAHKNNHKIIGFVPTMGAIHGGHISLVEMAKKDSNLAVVSIFVNQKQFNDLEDYKNYPKNLSSDLEKLKGVADILFLPDPDLIYGDDFATKITLSKLTNILCGKVRPGHFNGVALIITKLFNIVRPDLAFFGEKDFQQLQVIKKLASDLNFDTKIVGCRTFREPSGLAISSRNSRLDNQAKDLAPKIYQLLSNIKDQILEKKAPNLKRILEDGENWLKSISSKFTRIDYLEIRFEENLKLVKKFNPKIKSRIFIAVYLDQVRLIDNLELY